jgi:hypothetical protein
LLETCADTFDVIDDANFDPASGNVEVVESRSGNSFDRFTDFIWCMPRRHDDPTARAYRLAFLPPQKPC